MTSALRREPLAPSNKTRTIGNTLALNFFMLTGAEVFCRGLSLLVTLLLYNRIGSDGFGRVEFCFSIVFWLVLIVRDCFETIVTREIARHPRLTRRLANQVLTLKIILALGFIVGLAGLSRIALQEPDDQLLLSLYGLLLLTTALGLDFVFRGHNAMGVVAVSLFVRTSVYAALAWWLVDRPSRVMMVPICLATGEMVGILLVWAAHAARFGVPRLELERRVTAVLLNRGRKIGVIHFCQAVMISVDFLVVGCLNRWSEVGRYGGAHRIIVAVLALGLIFQQVAFPVLSRRGGAFRRHGRRVMDTCVRAMTAGLLPIAIGGALLANPLVALLFPKDHAGSGILLAIGIWRAPLLSLAFLYQSALIATSREAAGLRILVIGSLVSAPMVALCHWGFGLPGASIAVDLIALSLVVAGYLCLKETGTQPAFHHHLGRPFVASAVMVPACLAGLRVHVVAAIVCGGLAYLATLWLMGGLAFDLGPDDDRTGQAREIVV